MPSESTPKRPIGSNDLESSKRARLRGPKEASKTHEEWEAIKEPFREFYVEQGLKLEEVMTLLEQSFGFKAS